MKYRKFGKLDWEVSVLGFGAMRLPVMDKNHGQIDVPEATRMLRYAIDGGINYVDTAYPYHEGASETFLASALGDGYREKVKIATKMPIWLTHQESDFDRFLDEQLVKLNVSKIDFYLLHGLNRKRWHILRDLQVCDWAEKAMADGRIGYLGFSFHDSNDLFIEIVDYYDNWTLAQIQYNYMDVDYQAGIRGLNYAAGKGLAVVIMEPLRGGMLAKQPPDSVQALWQQAPQHRSPVEYALQWIWNHPDVSVVLSGMSTMPQVEENIISASRS
jgi:predicted aldo/keto reductase-like oxidoreductase